MWPLLALTWLGCATVSVPAPASADPPPRHGASRRAHLAEAAATRPPLPQDCAMDPFHADYGGLERGSRVRLGRHREVEGDAFWAAAMDAFVGRVTTITGARGVDEKGCPVVSVRVDEGEYDWRVRDLEVVSSSAVGALMSVELAPGFAGDPRTFTGTVVAEERFETRSPGCPGIGSRAATMRLSLTSDFESISFLAHADQDLVLMVRTPEGETICADDVDDLDPVIAGNANHGVYEIWVGAYDGDADGLAFRLGISEKLTVRTVDLERMNAEPIVDRVTDTDTDTDTDAGAGPTSDDARAPAPAPNTSESDSPEAPRARGGTGRTLGSPRITPRSP